MIIEKLKQDLLSSRLIASKGIPDQSPAAKALASCLTTLISDVEKPDSKGVRDTSDKNVVSKIRKYIENAEFTLSKLPEGDARRFNAEVEMANLPGYLPKEPTVEEISKFLLSKYAFDYITPKLRGEMMKSLKEKFGDALNGSVASKVVGDLLATK